MTTQVEMRDIVETLETLPPDKVAEVRDFVDFLAGRYAADVLTAVQREELQRRLAAYEENPNEGMPWEAFYERERARA